MVGIVIIRINFYHAGGFLFVPTFTKIKTTCLTTFQTTRGGLLSPSMSLYQPPRPLQMQPHLKLSHPHHQQQHRWHIRLNWCPTYWPTFQNLHGRWRYFYLILFCLRFKRKKSYLRRWYHRFAFVWCRQPLVLYSICEKIFFGFLEYWQNNIGHLISLSNTHTHTICFGWQLCA